MKERPWFPRVIPFLIYMAFIAIESIISFLSTFFDPLVTFSNYDQYLFYPVKTIIIAITILYFWGSYAEIRGKILSSLGRLLVSILIGVIVFILWINMDWGFATFGRPEGFNPYVFSEGLPPIPGWDIIPWTLISFRLLGAAVVVPVFEELFWRSFIIRYIISPGFDKVPLGRFTWPSFLATSILFGMEHHLWLAGILAGVAYNLLLYSTRNLSFCIISHGVTNLLLGIYVLWSHNWHFW